MLFRSLVKVFSVLLLLFSYNLLFIINTRSTFVAIAFVSLIFLVGVIAIKFYQKIRMRDMLKLSGLYFIPICLAMILSTVLINHVKSCSINQDSNHKFGTPLERIQKINFEEGNIRFTLWKDALVDRKSTRLNSSHSSVSRMPSSA